LATFRERFPSRQAILIVFAACVVPIHVWAIIAILRAINPWMLSMTLWEVLGVIAYPLTFALFESLLILAGLWVTAILLPGKIYRNWFVSQSTLIIFFASIWAVIMQIYGQEWRLWSNRGLISGLLVLFVVIAVFTILNARFKRLQKAIEALAERLVILGIVYIIMDIFFLFVFIYRNLLPA
jgi:hypothetical protein